MIDSNNQMQVMLQNCWCLFLHFLLLVVFFWFVLRILYCLDKQIENPTVSRRTRNLDEMLKNFENARNELRESIS